MLAFHHTWHSIFEDTLRCSLSPLQNKQLLAAVVWIPSGVIVFVLMALPRKSCSNTSFWTKSFWTNLLFYHRGCTKNHYPNAPCREKIPTLPLACYHFSPHACKQYINNMNNPYMEHFVRPDKLLQARCFHGFSWG